MPGVRGHPTRIGARSNTTLTVMTSGKERRSGADGVNQRQFRAHSSTGWRQRRKQSSVLSIQSCRTGLKTSGSRKNLEHLDLVLDPTWNLEHVTFAENNLAPIDRELQHAFQDLRNLLAPCE